MLTIFDPGLDTPTMVDVRERKHNPSEIDVVAIDGRRNVLYTIASFNARGPIDLPASAVTWRQWIAGQTIVGVNDDGLLEVAHSAASRPVS
jgi:hypothetical protein